MYQTRDLHPASHAALAFAVSPTRTTPMKHLPFEGNSNTDMYVPLLFFVPLLLADNV